MSEILIDISVTLRATFLPPSAPSAYEENRPLLMLIPPEHVRVEIKPPWLFGIEGLNSPVPIINVKNFLTLMRNVYVYVKCQTEINFPLSPLAMLWQSFSSLSYT